MSENGKLKFEFPHKQADIARLLAAGDSISSEEAQILATDNDRYLEDYLNSLQSGTTETTRSLLQVVKSSDSTTLSPNHETGICTTTITAPATPGFDYWMDCSANTSLYVWDDGSGTPSEIGTIVYLRDESGFYIGDGWLRLRQTWPNYDHTGDSSDAITGMARELSKLDASETRNVIVQCSNNSSSVFDIKFDVTLHIKLFAIPTAP